jgi:hypothetical protein
MVDLTVDYFSAILKLFMTYGTLSTGTQRSWFYMWMIGKSLARNLGTSVRTTLAGFGAALAMLDKVSGALNGARFTHLSAE